MSRDMLLQGRWQCSTLNTQRLFFPAFEIETYHAHRNVLSDLAEKSPELSDHPKYYSSSERWKEGKEKPGIFSVKLLVLHTVFFTGQACCPADAQPVLLIFHFQMEATSWPALGQKPAESLMPMTVLANSAGGQHAASSWSCHTEH